ncbi:MAG: hypothetical protein SPF69_07470 [Candidatus Ornithospirochaeta sp.]|nr:hypothetical protein [Sphaerochaetaceae bacterium]MDY5523910.1 hypothetical protein [Candidatus Ornithospirochaeta sp.]
MKKFFLISFILTAILLSLVSCTKKEKEKDSPVVVAAMERTEESRTPVVASEEEKEEDKKEEVKEEKSGLVKTAEEASLLLRKDYSSDSIRIVGIFNNGSATLQTYKVTFTEDEMKSSLEAFFSEYPDYSSYSFSLSGKDIKISYPESVGEDEVEAFWSSLVTFLEEKSAETKPLELEGNVGSISFRAVSDEEGSEVAIPEGVDESDIVSFMEYLVARDPSLAGKAEYSFQDSTLSLIYVSPLKEEEVKELWASLLDRVREYVEEQETTEIAPIAETETIAQKVTEEKKEEQKLPSPLTAAGRMVLDKSVSLSLSGLYDPDSSLSMEIKGAFSMEIAPSIHLGLKAGYDSAGYIPLLLSLRYDTSLLSGLYLYGDLGWRFGLDGNKGGALIGVGVGYEREIVDDFILFGELDLRLMLGENIRLMPQLSLGGRYIF